MSQAILNELMAVLDEDHAHAVIEHRRVTIRKPLTVYGAKRLASKLAAWGDANEAADIMIDRLWQGFECEWVKDRRSLGNRKRTIVDAARDRINELYGHHGNHTDAQRLPDEQGRPGSDAGHVRNGYVGPFVPSRH